MKIEEDEKGRYIKVKVYFKPYANLRFADLRSADLRFADLRSADPPAGWVAEDGLLRRAA